jgi:hypothetical protein
MEYFTTLIKTNYTRLYLEQQQKVILEELKKTPEFKKVKTRILNTSNNIETSLELAIWPLNGQRINEKLKGHIFSSVKIILGEQFILSIESSY